MFSYLYEEYLHEHQSCKNRIHGYTCSLNRTTLAYRTVYKHLHENNCTERMQRYHENDGNITGTILKWNIADIFDEPSWHFDQADCSHFCYVPPLYEAAFERLELLLPPLD